jgi:hypothetical protein
MTTTKDMQAPADGALVPTALFDPAEAGGQLAVPDRAAIVAMLGAQPVPFEQWLRSLLTEERFEEADHDAAAFSIARAVLLAETSEAALSALTLVSVGTDMCVKPGDRSSVIEFRGARPMLSTFEDGPGCFAIIDGHDLAEDRPLTMSCGGRGVQLVLMKHMMEGWMPFRGVLVRRLKPTQAGYYPVNLEQGI